MAMIGEATVLKYEGDVVAGVFSISGADSSVAEVERTALGDVSKQFRPSQQIEAGTISFSLYYNPADAMHNELRALAVVPSVPTDIPSWTIEFSNGFYNSFEAFITECNMSANEAEGETTLEFTLQITGAITEEE
jgi:hypothetical protein